MHLDAGEIARLDTEDAERYARLEAPGALLDAALYYAETLGVPVFPITPQHKLPLPRSAGFKDATHDTGQISAWWAARPDANIGLATGHHFDVIDIDGPAGVKTWAEILDELPPVLGHVSTPRPGGNHLYVAATGRGNRAGILPGIDYRGLGGYVLAPPSALVERRKRDGSIDQHAGRYRWIRHATAPARPARGAVA